MFLCKNCGCRIHVDIKTNYANHIDVHDACNEEYLTKYCPCGCQNPRIASMKEKELWLEISRLKSLLHEEYYNKVKEAEKGYLPKFIKCNCGCTGHGMFGKSKPFWKFW